MSFNIHEAIDAVVELCEERSISVSESSSNDNDDSSSGFWSSVMSSFGNSSPWKDKNHLVEPQGNTISVKAIRRVLDDLNSDQRQRLKSRMYKVLQRFGENSLSAINGNGRLKDAMEETIREFLTRDLHYKIV